MKVRAPSRDGRYFDVQKLIHGAGLHTVCQIPSGGYFIYVWGPASFAACQAKCVEWGLPR